MISQRSLSLRVFSFVHTKFRGMDIDTTNFSKVAFITEENRRLEGWFRPEWFRNSSFEDCKLPASLTKESLTKGWKYCYAIDSHRCSCREDAKVA
jgi:hypothetical protein